MNQSKHARPCNCDQALKAEAVGEALNLTCAAQGRKLAAIEKILLNYAIKPNLRACSFTTQPLEAIRLAMLERPW